MKTRTFNSEVKTRVQTPSRMARAPTRNPAVQSIVGGVQSSLFPEVIRRIPTLASPTEEDAVRTDSIANDEPDIVRRMGAPTRTLEQNVVNWNIASGDDLEVPTDTGTAVTGWDAYSPNAYNYHYWCHGHSMGTFVDFGYSVYSGPSMRQAVRDDYKSVSASKLAAGDILVWVPSFGHSAKVERVVRSSSGAIDPQRTMLSSKNGGNPLATQSLTQVAGIYRRLPDTRSSTPGMYRKK